MATTAKALAMRDELASELKIRLSALAQAKSGESDLMIGAGTAGTDSVFIRFTPVSTIQKDILGLAQTVFCPHIAQIVIENSPSAGAGADVGTWATRLAVIACLVQKGIRVELYTVANTTAPSASGITGAPAAAFDGHVQYPQSASM